MGGTDAGLRFWLRYVENAGGLSEDAGDSAVVVLPDSLQGRYRHPDEMLVTSDPDVAREDGATLLLAGHPLLMQAAEAVLDQGDCGLIRLPRPLNPPPDTEVLLAAAREQFPVDHGRIDAIGGVAPGVRYVLRVGALVTFAVSADVHFQEQMECWVDVPSCLELAHPVVAPLRRLIDDERRERTELPATAELVPALEAAHTQIDRRATTRAADLSTQAGDDHTRESDRAVAYYEEALRSLQRRLDGAAPERAVSLSAKMVSTRAERDRRLAEISEKYHATHAIRPFRLHALAVPVLRLPVDVRRGDRRSSLTLEWLLPARTFARIRCPGCASTAPLVAAKSGLGCRRCVAKPESRHEQAREPAGTGTRAERPRPPTHAVAPSQRAPLSRPEPPSPPEPAQRPLSLRQAQSRPGRGGIAAVEAVQARPAHSAEATQRAGRKLSESLWDRSTAGNRRVRRLCAPHSPADALGELFGPAGPLYAVGLGDGEQPLSMNSSASRPAPGSPDVLLISGQVHTRAWSYGYQLCWRFTGGAALIEEVTPFPSAYWPRLPEPRYLGPIGYRLYETTPEPGLDLDAVADRLWHRAVAMHGLPLAVRCFAAWWRLEDRDQLLALHPPGALAAAIDRMVAYRAGAGGRYDDAASTYRVAVSMVRAATADLQRRLRLSATCPW